MMKIIVDKFSRNFLLLFLLSIFIFSCKKEQVPEITIEITQPADGHYAHFLDSVRVIATVKSETEIKSVSIYFVNTSGASVSSSLNFFPNSTHYKINQLCIPNDEYSPSGNYNLIVSASDGNYTKKKSVPVYLEAAKKKTKALYVFGNSGNHSFNIYEIDSTLLIFKKNVTGDFIDGYVSSRKQQLVTCCKTTGGINYFSTPDFQNLLTLPPVNPMPAPSFTSYHFYDELHYIGQYDGTIKAYDSNGFMSFYTLQNPYFESNLLLRTPNYLAAELVSVSGQSNNLTIYYYPSGIGKQFLNIDFDIISMYEFSNDELILFTVKNAHVLIYKYSLIYNSVNLIKDAGQLNLYQATQISSAEYLLSAAEGVFHFDYTTNTAYSVATFPCHDIEFDEVNNLYYCSSSFSIHRLNGSNFSEDGNIVSVDSVFGIRVLYTK